MHKNILKKCLEELEKESFSKDYVRGMLETLYEIEAPGTKTITGQTTLPTPYATGQTTAKEEVIEDELPAFLKPGPVGNMEQH